MRAALAPADPHQHEEEEDPQDHQADKHPLWKDAEKRTLEPAAVRAATLIGVSLGRGTSRKDLGRKASCDGAQSPHTQEEV